MPFTFSHPAAVLPFVPPLRDGRARGPLIASALVAGSLAPDVPFFLESAFRGSYGVGAATHRPWAVVTLDVAIAAGLVGAWHGLLREPLVALLPEPWADRAEGLTAGGQARPLRRRLVHRLGRARRAHPRRLGRLHPHGRAGSGWSPRCAGRSPGCPPRWRSSGPARPPGWRAGRRRGPDAPRGHPGPAPINLRPRPPRRPGLRRRERGARRDTPVVREVRPGATGPRCPRWSPSPPSAPAPAPQPVPPPTPWPPASPPASPPAARTLSSNLRADPRPDGHAVRLPRRSWYDTVSVAWYCQGPSGVPTAVRAQATLWISTRGDRSTNPTTASNASSGERPARTIVA
ncbi:DUF4184 family protein [Streptacidiphilus sp. 4-A2]|nr:DUF4184 family protein [Streptacidiphilus sp. 4-A2]